ncbi:hypothetical protein CVT24_003824 [Panaeolus cyanescens]|uniref:Phosphatidylinositol-specific phospholipase C X domain-containing protein n=1 Tax=Panaeolus cyanescens TaxID=181874 RepID=A0A409W816_9AGAR|nr:hypothetical protein CVT24_003824 [Panaeolus cyanescens]
MFASVLCIVSLSLLSLVPLLPVGAMPDSSGLSSAQSRLNQAALDDILQRAAPIAGVDQGCSRSSKTCDWMAKFPDSVVSLPFIFSSIKNVLGNYSDTTQASLLRYTGPIPPAPVYRCQEHSIIQSLNEGIRVFDLRFSYNPGNDTIGFYHSLALLSPTTRMEDVFFALYDWLNKHPTEAVLVSMNYEGGGGRPEDAALYEKLYNILNTPLAKQYWVQTNGTLGTLGEARGKLTLLQRWSYRLLPSDMTARIGIPLDPDHWTVNGKATELVYNVAKNQIAYIEDFYAINTVALGSGQNAYIDAKFEATTAHLTNATRKDLHPDQLYISFASAAFIDDTPPMTPHIFAVGNGTDVLGMNQRLIPWLKARKGQRFGIIMLDFYDAVPGLVEAVIGV